MATGTIKSPLEWIGAQFLRLIRALAASGRALLHVQETLGSPAPAIRRIGLDDLKDALSRGTADFAAYRSDVFFLVFFYPILNVIIARVAFGMHLLPLLFPMASGFAIIGPVAGIGLYEMSRQREQGRKVSWLNGFDVVSRPAIGALALLSVLLAAIFLAWLAVAWSIYGATMGPALPQSMMQFTQDVLMTGAGRSLIVIGCGVGFLFAVLAMAVSVVSFPLLVDRDVGLDTAILASVRAVIANPVPMAAWGLIVAGGLFLGSLPFFLGLIVVLPILGHTTWHLYRKIMPA